MSLYSFFKKDAGNIEFKNSRDQTPRQLIQWGWLILCNKYVLVHVKQDSWSHALQLTFLRYVKLNSSAQITQLIRVVCATLLADFIFHFFHLCHFATLPFVLTPLLAKETKWQK
jgi:hypothetical protein